MADKIDSKLSDYERFQCWFGNNALKLSTATVIIVIMALAYSLLVTEQQGKRDKFYRTVLARATQYAIVATPDGRIVPVEKQKLSPAVLKAYIKNSILNYFILDRNDFTVGNGFITADPNNPHEFFSTLIGNSPKIKKLSAFFDARDKDSTEMFYVFLKYLYGMAKAGTLPDTIAPTGNISNEKFYVKGNTFTYTGSIEAKVFYIGIDSKWHQAVGSIDLKVVGRMSPLYSKGDDAEVNPYGFKVESMQFSWIKV